MLFICYSLLKYILTTASSLLPPILPVPHFHLPDLPCQLLFHFPVEKSKPPRDINQTRHNKMT